MHAKQRGFPPARQEKKATDLNIARRESWDPCPYAANPANSKVRNWFPKLVAKNKNLSDPNDEDGEMSVFSIVSGQLTKQQRHSWIVSTRADKAQSHNGTLRHLWISIMRKLAKHIDNSWLRVRYVQQADREWYNPAWFKTGS
jgi:hypothetical protein